MKQTILIVLLGVILAACVYVSYDWKKACEHDYQLRMQIEPTETAKGMDWYECTKCKDGYVIVTGQTKADFQIIFGE